MSELLGIITSNRANEIAYYVFELHVVLALWIFCLWFFKRPLYKKIWANKESWHFYAIVIVICSGTGIFFDQFVPKGPAEQNPLPFLYCLAYGVGISLFVLVHVFQYCKKLRSSIPESE